MEVDEMVRKNNKITLNLVIVVLPLLHQEILELAQY